MRQRSRRRRPEFPCLLQVERLESRELLDSALGQEALQIARADGEVEINVVPNDPSFGGQWALNNTGQNGGKVDADIDAVEAWDVQRGSLSTVVAVIDTGIDYRHKDLYRNIWINQGEIPASIRNNLIDTDSDGLITFWDLNDSRNQGVGKITDLNANGRIDGGDILKPTAQGGWSNGVSDDGDSYKDDLIGWDFVNNDNDPLDDNNHGTHVSGIIGATGQDGIGVAGVNWKVSMMAIKTIPSTGKGAMSVVLTGLRYAIDHGADISNNSYGGTEFNQAMYDTIDAARAQGHIFVVSAGNGGSDLVGDNLDVTPEYPAAYNLRNVVAVAATTRNDGRYAPSNYGARTVELGAPGREIISTIRNDAYATWSGTSMAAPHVAGVFALLRSQHPDWAYFDLVDQVLATTDYVAALAGKTVTNGRVNAFRALTAPRADTTGPTVVSMVPNASGAMPVSRVRVTFSEAIDPATFTLADIRSFTGPNGSLAVSGIVKVPNSDDTVFDVTFSQQSTPGTYRLELGPNIRDRAGNAMDQDRDGILGETTGDSVVGTFVIEPVRTFTNSTATAIRDESTTVSTIDINQDLTIADVNVQINIRHTFDNDLGIYLRAPDGTEVRLVYRRGGAGDNFNNTILDDEATNSLWNASAPFNGSYKPETPLSALDGKNARGTWQLRIQDLARADTGTLNSWSLTIEKGGSVGTASVDTDSVAGPQEAESEKNVTIITPAGDRANERSHGHRSAREKWAVNPVNRLIDATFSQDGPDLPVWGYAPQQAAPPPLEELVMFFARRR